VPIIRTGNESFAEWREPVPFGRMVVKFGMFYPAAVASEDELGKGLWGLDRARYAKTIDELREQAICADETGWTSMMFAEHHFEIEGYHVTPNPLMLNIYLAQHTKRLRQGQMGLVLPNWNPLRLAEDIAMADHLTGGRLDVGLSRGYQPRSVGVMGQHYHAGAAGTGRAETEATNRKIVEEWYEVMRRCWTEDLWSFQGEFISIPPSGLEWKHPVSARLMAGVEDGILKQIASVPKPKQLPHPPLFTTLTQSPETLNWSARIGSSVVTLAANLDIVRWVFQSYIDEAAKHGRPLRFGEYSAGGGVVLCRNLAVGSTHDEAMETARQGSAFWTQWLGEFGFFEALRMKGQEGPVPKTFQQMLDSGFQIVGTPETVCEQIQRLKEELNVEYIIFIMYGGITEHKRMMETIRLFGEHVIPKFQDASAGNA
jgi:alkanesulfonate monooxygenase SsuD/methylene tetrahydromethanopterin reductase-like flavin-dependent oxidoreductase (luciferase family)